MSPVLERPLKMELFNGRFAARINAKSFPTVTNLKKKAMNEEIYVKALYIYFFFRWALGCVDHEVDLSGSKWCVLSAELSRGKGDVAWQHAQIARQSTKGSNDEYPLVFRILFGSAD